MNINKISFSLAICNLVFAPVFASGITAFTKPSADVTLSFIQPGRIQKINYRKGDSVKVGDVLVQLDDSVEQVRLAQLEAESKDKTQIEASEAKLAQSRVDLEEREKIPKAVTPLELEYARLNLKIAELTLRMAIFQNEQAQRKYEEAKLQIERMRLKSPIDGKIEAIKGIEIETGESVNALEDVVRVVRIDPLWIDVEVPLDQTTNLKYGRKAVVEFPDPKSMSIEGTVIYIAAVADAASDTLNVCVQVPNSTNRPAGEHVTVTFPTSSE
ncbi:MAG: efflux RND transporter periplasmic adaptor subunit [Sedimentisphaerales bacterium]|nr:efflux RND transporter periplasmic adaptor subunit [Sedimentisphaerales bacterium]